MGVGGQRHALTALPPGKGPCTHCTGDWVDPRAGLAGCGKSLSTGIRYPDRPALSESLYPLRYPDPQITGNGNVFHINILKAYRGRRGTSPPFLASTLDGGNWLTSRPSRITPAKKTTVPIEQEAGWVT